MLLDFVYVGSRIPLEEEGLEDEHPMVPEAIIAAIIVPLKIYYSIYLLANSTHALLFFKKNSTIYYTERAGRPW